MRKPDFFIVGQTRSGTNSLQFQLEQHPEIFISKNTKTIFGFKKQINSEKEYLNQFTKIKQKIIGERNTDYLVCSTSAEKIKKFNPNAKIIMILRNPIDVMYSVHSTALSRGIDENIQDFETALDEQENRKIDEEKNPGKYSPFVFYYDVGKYSIQVKRYIENFEPKNILIIKFEEFIENPHSQFKNICDFLDINSDFIPTIKKMNQYRTVRNQKLKKIADLAPKNAIGQKMIKSKTVKRIYSKINRPAFTREKLKISVRDKIIQEIKTDIDDLSKSVKMDFSYWYKSY